MPDGLLVRIAKPGQQDHYVPERRARELEDDGWTVIDEQSSSLAQSIDALTEAVRSLQASVGMLAAAPGAEVVPPAVPVSPRK